VPNRIRIQTNKDGTRLLHPPDSMISASFFTIQFYWDLLAQTSVLNHRFNRPVFANFFLIEMVVLDGISELHMSMRFFIAPLYTSGLSTRVRNGPYTSLPTVLDYVSTSNKRSCSAAIRNSMAIRRPLDIGLRHRALP
jgi:hypothetical protein